MRRKWLISVSEEPNMIKTTLDNGRGLRQFIIDVSLFLAFQAIRKSYKYVKFRLTTNQDLFDARSSIRDGDYFLLSALRSHSCVFVSITRMRSAVSMEAEESRHTSDPISSYFVLVHSECGHAIYHCFFHILRASVIVTKYNLDSYFYIL